jgi:hypothetical protein
MDNNWIQQIYFHRKKEYSQTGEEGFLEFILDNIGHGKKFLVDIGAGDGQYLSNTKYFLEYLGYKGIMIDGNPKDNEQVKKEWITSDNICDILKKYKCPKEFTLLSLDLDGNDFDIIKSICGQYKPMLIVCEINGTIPEGVSKKIVYNPNHTWNNDDYYGFSFSAGLKLAEAMGYKAVFQNDALNLYLVRKDLLENPEEAINLNFQHCQYHPHNPYGIWEEV